MFNSNTRASKKCSYKRSDKKIMATYFLVFSSSHRHLPADIKARSSVHFHLKSLSCSLFYAPVPLDGMLLPDEKSKGSQSLPSWCFSAGRQLPLGFCLLNRRHLPIRNKILEIAKGPVAESTIACHNTHNIFESKTCFKFTRN